MPEDESAAYLSMGFRKWAAQTVPLRIHKSSNGVFYFVVPAPAAEHDVQHPQWIFNTSAKAENSQWKACSVQVLHPATLGRELQQHTVVLKQSTAVEPLVKAALRSGKCFLERKCLEKVCKENQTAAPFPPEPRTKRVSVRR